MTSPYLRPAEAAAYLRFTTADAFLAWTRRHHVPHIKAGRVVLFERDILLAAFTRSVDGAPARPPQARRIA